MEQLELSKGEWTYHKTLLQEIWCPACNPSEAELCNLLPSIGGSFIGKKMTAVSVLNQFKGDGGEVRSSVNGKGKINAMRYKDMGD